MKYLLLLTPLLLLSSCTKEKQKELQPEEVMFLVEYQDDYSHKPKLVHYDKDCKWLGTGVNEMVNEVQVSEGNYLVCPRCTPKKEIAKILEIRSTFNDN